MSFQYSLFVHSQPVFECGVQPQVAYYERGAGHRKLQEGFPELSNQADSPRTSLIPFPLRFQDQPFPQILDEVTPSALRDTAPFLFYVPRESAGTSSMLHVPAPSFQLELCFSKASLVHVTHLFRSLQAFPTPALRLPSPIPILGRWPNSTPLIPEPAVSSTPSTCSSKSCRTANPASWSVSQHPWKG